MTEYLKNIDTDRVFPATKILMHEADLYGRLVPCDEDGHTMAPVQDLSTENAKLRERIVDLEAQLEMLQSDNKTPETITEIKLPTEPNRIEAIVTAIGQLERDNPDHFTGQGLPRVEVLEAFAQIPEVSGAERDEAWARFNA